MEEVCISSNSLSFGIGWPGPQRVWVDVKFAFHIFIILPILLVVALVEFLKMSSPEISSRDPRPRRPRRCARPLR
jgi:hypothetical protein